MNVAALEFLPPRHGAARRLGRWYAVAALLLVLMLAGVGWLQTRSLGLLNGAVLYEGDNLLWSFYQLDSEYLRVRELLRVIAVNGDPQGAKSDTGALRERYEIFVSRISLIEPERMRHVMPVLEGQEQVLHSLQAFVARADPLLGAGAGAGRLDPAVCRELLAGFEPLASPLHQLALAANQALAEYANRRNEAVRDTNRMSIALALFQCLLTIALAALLVRQLKSLEGRRVKLEELAHSLQEARTDAEQASRAKSAFLANMSHELRTPFNGLLGMLSLLQTGRLDAEQADQLRTARESAEHLLAILDDVLDVSRLDSGHLDIAPGAVDLGRVLADVDALMGPQARARGLALVVDIGPGLPAQVHADGKRLKQIIFNLVGNAIKFTEIGAVRIQAGVAPQPHDQTRPELVISVADTGIGMDAQTLSRLFHRFSQGDDSIQRRFGGTGLGLEISRTLARLMGGDIGVTSEPGRGSVFTLSLPLEVLAATAGDLAGTDAVATGPSADLASSAARPPAQVATSTPSTSTPDLEGAGQPLPLPRPGPSGVTLTLAQQPQPPSPSAAAPPPATPPRSAAALRVLVCDDHPVNRKLLTALLGRLGLTASLCENGAEALDQVRDSSWDLVLMDMHMPVMDGLSATRAIRALGPRGQGVAHLVVVAVTADAFDEARQLALAAGMDDVLTKPMQLRDLRACLLRNFPGLDLAPSAAA
ncbi:MAG: hypothetical protein RLZZ584_819 [Pseudomonadota bacterium]|jgi:signal transduction histidine kinase/ActR/RegA family two-component response regulator